MGILSSETLAEVIVSIVQLAVAFLRVRSLAISVKRVTKWNSAGVMVQVANAITVVSKSYSRKIP